MPPPYRRPSAARPGSREQLWADAGQYPDRGRVRMPPRRKVLLATAGMLGALVLIAAVGVVLHAVSRPPQLRTPDHAGGLTRVSTPAGLAAADRARQQLRAAGAPAGVAAVYAEPPGATPTVLVLGARRAALPDAEPVLRAAAPDLAPGALAWGTARDYPPGVLGGTLRCGPIRAGATAGAFCAWRDGATAGGLLTLGHPPDYAARLTNLVRHDVER